MSGGTEMLKRTEIPLLALSIVLLAGCATSRAVGPPADVNGTWTGGSAAGARTYTLVLKQTGAQVTGTLTGAGTLDGPVEGIVEGNTIRLREQEGFAETPALMVRGDQITGW